MAGAGKVFQRRMPAYLGGLLLSLGAMLVIFQAKRAFMPKFHLLVQTRDDALLAAGGGIRVIYNQEPGYFLIPGMPTGVVVSQKQADGNFAPILRLQYGDLVEKAPLIGPFPEEGAYKVEANLFICKEPGVADCTKLVVSQAVMVEKNAGAAEARMELDLPKLAEFGLEQGKLATQVERGK